jgi:serine/threonine-protein kinase
VNAADLREQVQAALDGAYTIEREIGRGGMATVFLARDEKHHRSVAVKVLRPEFAATVGPERFRREITLAAGLQHPHILPVFDSGETADGLLWFSMPYIAGETLRGRIRREGQLPFDEAVRITREVAAALEYAHKRGIVHRDVKPENIMVTADGDVLLTDFGIARAMSMADSDEPTDHGATLTESGYVVGTPAYMSPEQASGKRGIDARTDVYSLAAVAYEMLAGEPPFIAATPQAMIAKMLVTTAPSVRIVRPNVPMGVDTALRRALAQLPGDRFPSAAEFATALELGRTMEDAPASRTRRLIERWAIGVGLVVLLTAAGTFAWQARGRAAVGPPMVAVLPFDNLGDSADAYFAEGMTDEVRGKLAALHGLRVIASGSSDQYRHTTKSQEAIARELGVQYLLVGHVRWQRGAAGHSHVRVDPELVQLVGAQPMLAWKQDFDADLSDVFTVQTEIASRVAAELQVTLGTGERAALTERPTRNLDAYDQYLRGKAYQAGGNDVGAQRRAAAAFAEAVRLDPSFALAWAALAVSHANIYGMQNAAKIDGDSAEHAAARAIALRPQLPESHAAMSYYLTAVRRDFARALAEAELARTRNPNNADLLDQQGYAEGHLGRWDAAIAHLDTAVRLDPRDDNARGDLGFAQLFVHRYDDARSSLDRSLTFNPANLTTIEWRMLVSLANGDADDAHRIASDALTHVDSTTLIAYVASVRDLGWALDATLRRALRRLTPAAFDNDRAAWGLALAESFAQEGDTARGRAYADSARLAYQTLLQATPNDPELHAHYGVALALAGKGAEAISEGERAATILPIGTDARDGVYVQHQLARIYMLTGHTTKALAVVQPLLRAPGYLSPRWLQIDPDFAILARTPPAGGLAANSRGGR